MSNVRTSKAVRWYSELNRYQWWVLVVATLGWLFDSMDQRLFVLSRTPAIRQLIPNINDAQVAVYAAESTSIFILGWATGGVIFGLFGDRFGRTRAMTLTILIYSLFTGLSACATSWVDFAAYRFLCGLGIGGEYAAGVSLVAEVMPDRARPYCLGLLQGLSALGHVAGSIVSYYIGPQSDFYGLAGWRWLFLVGVLPALLAVVVRWRLREPDAWMAERLRAAALGDGSPTASQVTHRDDVRHKLGSLREVFANPTLRYHVLIGMTLGVCGQIGLWGIGYWTPELIRGSQQELRQTESQLVATDAWKKADDELVARGTILQDTAGMCGIYAFTLLTTRVGRRRAFAASYALAFASTVYVFNSLRTTDDVYWMAPLLGFSISSVYGGFAIYFPELFPTRLRSTGTALCYNAARYVTAFGPLLLGRLMTLFAQQTGAGLPLRGAAMSLSTIYLLGLIASRYAPETHGRPLPE